MGNGWIGIKEMSQSKVAVVFIPRKGAWFHDTYLENDDASK
jgi:hypothetical protein